MPRVSKKKPAVVAENDAEIEVHDVPVSDDSAENSAEEQDGLGNGPGSAAASDSDSDSLDNDGPRKRRRTSPKAADGDPELQFVRPAFNVPSRIKRSREQQQQQQQQTKILEPALRVLAPVDVNTSFESLGVRPWLIQSLANMAIKRPTGIQKASIPEILKGRDCTGGSRTGSGKTVAFAVPILQQWAENPSAIFALVLTPTR